MCSVNISIHILFPHEKWEKFTGFIIWIQKITFFSTDILIRYNQTCPIVPMNVPWKHRMKVIILNYTTPIIAELDDKILFFCILYKSIKKQVIWIFLRIFRCTRNIQNKSLNCTIKFTKANFTIQHMTREKFKTY